MASATIDADGRVNTQIPNKKETLTTARSDAQRCIDSCDLGHHLPINPQRHYDRMTSIASVRQQAAPNQNLWDIEYSDRRTDEEGESKYRLRVDAASDWSVIDMEEISRSERSNTHHTLANLFGQNVATETLVRNTGDAGDWTFQMRFRELSPTEAQMVREEAETIAQRRPEANRYAMSIQPLPIAIAWPAAGMLLLVGGIVLRPRVKLPASIYSSRTLNPACEK
jgi:hypothetical protein